MYLRAAQGKGRIRAFSCCCCWGLGCEGALLHGARPAAAAPPIHDAAVAVWAAAIVICAGEARRGQLLALARCCSRGKGLAKDVVLVLGAVPRLRSKPAALQHVAKSGQADRLRGVRVLVAVAKVLLTAVPTVQQAVQQAGVHMRLQLVRVPPVHVPVQELLGLEDLPAVAAAPLAGAHAALVPLLVAKHVQLRPQGAPLRQLTQLRPRHVRKYVLRRQGRPRSGAARGSAFWSERPTNHWLLENSGRGNSPLAQRYGPVVTPPCCRLRHGCCWLARRQAALLAPVARGRSRQWPRPARCWPATRANPSRQSTNQWTGMR